MKKTTRRDFLALGGAILMDAALPSATPAAITNGAQATKISTDGKKPIRRIEIGLGGGCIYCLSNRSYSQMFGAVIVSPTGRIAVVDGGCFADGENLGRILTSLGSHVDYWFLTHAHSDHYGALATILEMQSSKISIGSLCLAFPDAGWLNMIEPEESAVNRRFAAALVRHHGLVCTKLGKGQTFDLCCNWKISVLNDLNIDLKHPNVNDTGICFSLQTGNYSWLATGDIGVETGRKLVGELGERLQHEYVFMSHHGQNGADKSFYAAVKPHAAIWPTPDWLWENNAGEGPGSGPYNTNYTKCWMQELGVKRNYVLTEDILFV